MSRLFAKTRALLRETKVPIEKIAIETGINLYTIIRIKSPSNKSMPAVDTCEKLYEYLTGRQLEI